MQAKRSPGVRDSFLRYVIFSESVSRPSNIKLEIDSSRSVISARSNPAFALFDISQKCERRAKRRSGRAFIRARGYLPRFYLLRGADRQKRQIASRCFAEYAFRFPIATRLSACESMNREQMYPRILQKSLYKEQHRLYLYYIVLSFSP